jgi:threonine synthase
MVTVQAEGCAPIVRAFERGLDRGVVVEGPRTIADGLRVPRAVADFLMLRVLRASAGAAVSVSDESMIAAMRRLGATEGVSAAPEGGAALVAIERLVKQGRITRSDTVVLFNTGGALKYLDVLT